MRILLFRTALLLIAAVGGASEVVPIGAATADVSLALALPANARLLFTGGTVPPVRDRTATNAHARYGDTATQARAVLDKIAALLATERLSLRDVVQLRVYVAPDHEGNGRPDFAAWFAVYAEYFNHERNPARPVRSTIGVQTLVNPGWLIEIEAIALYPSPARTN